MADKGVRMVVRYYRFLSPVKRRLLKDVVYVITETVSKTARPVRWRGMYQRLVKVDPLKCILYGSQMRFTGLKRGSGRTGSDTQAAGATAGVRLRAAEGKLRPLPGKWTQKVITDTRNQSMQSI
ncbi:IS91 orf [Salmonella enterica subsp. enterica serovar Newport str. CVM 4176]|nr:IS91 orf [Salmonella enterica subsp. enterica serovar Newport str. CVM 4176]